MKLQYATSQKRLDEMTSIVNKRNNSMDGMPDFSLYNSTEQTSRKKQWEDKIFTEFVDSFNSLYNFVETDIKDLDRKIFKAKYPLLSNDAVFSTEESLRLRGTLEYQNAIQLINFILPRYPIQEIEEYSYQRRYDFVSALIDLSLKRTIGIGENTERNEFIKAVNKYYEEKIPVMKYMLEKLELEYVKTQMTYQYSVINATYSGTNTGGMKIGFAVTEKMEVEKITKAINDLLLR
jgi:hypothetical protein